VDEMYLLESLNGPHSLKSMPDKMIHLLITPGRARF